MTNIVWPDNQKKGVDNVWQMCTGNNTAETKLAMIFCQWNSKSKTNRTISSVATSIVMNILWNKIKKIKKSQLLTMLCCWDGMRFLCVIPRLKGAIVGSNCSTICVFIIQSQVTPRTISYRHACGRTANHSLAFVLPFPACHTMNSNCSQKA